MPRQKKVIRTKSLYKKRRLPQKAVSRILFILLIAILIGIGFIVMREWSARFGKNADKTKSSVPPSSVVTSSELLSSAPIVSSTPEAVPTVQTGKAARIAAADLLAANGNINDKLKTLKAEGYTSVSIELKAEDGMLAYKSTNEMAVSYGAVSENAIDLAALVKSITDAGLTPIAEISTLKDKKAPHVSNGNSYAYSTSLDVNWLDNSFDKGGKPWLNPYMDNARKYICDISKEISEAGFETILLRNIMFPDKNVVKMNTIKTEPSRESILNQLVTEVETAVSSSVTVIREIDVAATAIASETSFDAQIVRIPSENIGYRISLDSIENNKEKICMQSGIVGAEGYDKNMPPQEVMGHLLSATKATVKGNIIPIISQADFAKLEQVFKDNGITSYIVF